MSGSKCNLLVFFVTLTIWVCRNIFHLAPTPKSHGLSSCPPTSLPFDAISWIAHFQLKLASTGIKVFTFGCLNWAKHCGGVALMKPSDSEADKVGLRDQRLMNQQVRIRTLWESFSFFYFFCWIYCSCAPKIWLISKALASGAPRFGWEDLQLWSSKDHSSLCH